MAGAFDAKVVISTAEAVANFQGLKAATLEVDATLRTLDATFKSTQSSLNGISQSYTAIIAAERAAAAAAKETAASLVQQAKAEAELAKAQAVRSASEDNAALRAEKLATQSKTREVQEQRLATEIERTGTAENQRSASVDNAANAALRLQNAQDRTAKSQLELNDNLSNSRYLLYDVAATYGSLAAIMLAIPTATQVVAMEYQKDFAQVLRITDQSTAAAATLQTGLMNLGTQIPLSFKDMTDIAQLGAHLQLGNDGLVAFTETVAKFVAATGVATDQAATLFSRMKTMFTNDAQAAGTNYFNDMGSSIAQMGTKIVATDQQVTATATQLASVGAAAGMSTPEIIGLSGAMASLAIAPEMARGAMTRLFASFNRDASDATGKMSKFGEVMGLSGQQAASLWKTNPDDFFNKLIKGLNQTYTSGGDLTQLFDQMGVKNTRDVQTLTRLATGYDVLHKAVDGATQGYQNGTALDELSKPVYETAAAHLAELGTALKNLLASLGSASLGPLTGLLDWIKGIVTGFTDMVNQVPGVKIVVNSLLGFSAVIGVLLALKAAQALTLAGIVTFNQVAGSQGVQAGMKLGGTLNLLGDTFAKLTGRVAANTTVTAENAAAQTAAGSAVAGAAARTAEANVANTSFGSGLKNVGSSLLGLVGGPIGLLTGALVAVGLGFLDAEGKAKDAGKAIADAMAASGSEGLKATADELTKISIGPGDTIAWSLWGKNLRQVADDSGVSFTKMVDAATKGKDALAAITPELDRVAQSKGFKDFQDFYDNGGTDVAGLVMIRNKIRDIGDQEKVTTDNTQAVTQAMADLGISTDAAGNPIGETTTKLDTLTKSIQAAQDAIFGLVDAQSAVDDALGKLGAGLQKSGNFGTGTDVGRTNLKNFQDTTKAEMEYMAQMVTTGQMSAKQAAAGYASFIDNLITQIKAKGGDTTGIQNLANQTKATFNSLINANPAAEAPVSAKIDTSKVQAATDYLKSVQAKYGTIDVTVLAKQQGAAQVVKDVGTMQNYIKAATGKPYVAAVNANTTAANANVQRTQAFIVGNLIGKPFIATVNANTSPALQALQALAQFAASVVNSILDGVNGVNNAVSDFTGGLVNRSNYHVDWGMPQAPAAPQVAAAPSVPAAPAAAPEQVSAQADPNLDTGALDQGFGALDNGYDNAAQKAANAGNAGKKAGKDIADGLGDAASAADDFGNRLKTSLDAAFQQAHGVQSATDAYYTALNSITKKRDDELAQIQDLITKQQQLNDERDKELVTASKARAEQAISMKYGEGARAADYGNQAQTAEDNAAAKLTEMNADKLQQQTLQDGIGKLDGYTQAAIDNRTALRDLESKMNDMIVAYAKSGASQQDVANYAAGLTNTFRQQVVQLGYNQVGVEGLSDITNRYTDAVNRVPYYKPTTIATNAGDPALLDPINNLGSALDNAARNRTSNVDVNWNEHGGLQPIPGYNIDGQQVYNVIQPDGGVGRYRVYNEGGMVGYADGGLIPGTPPSDPRVDNLMAQVDGKGQVRVRSGEFIVQQPAVNYWGADFMNAINNMRMPMFNSGGSVGRSAPSGGTGVMVVTLDSTALAAIQRAGDRPVVLYSDDTMIAQSANNGNMILASRGHA